MRAERFRCGDDAVQDGVWWKEKRGGLLLRLRLFDPFDGEWLGEDWDVGVEGFADRFFGF